LVRAPIRISGKSEFGIVHGAGAALERTARIDLGLAILQCLARPGVPLTQADIAAWCGCARGLIYAIEQKALRKLHNRLLFIRDPRLVEAVKELSTLVRRGDRREAA
jgi:hypothetical protein